MKKIAILTSLGLLFGGMAAAEGDAQIFLAQSCAGGLMSCSPGVNGPGGCYNPGYMRCVRGIICNGDENVCIEDVNPNAVVPYCYNASLPNTCRR